MDCQNIFNCSPEMQLAVLFINIISISDINHIYFHHFPHFEIFTLSLLQPFFEAKKPNALCMINLPRHFQIIMFNKHSIVPVLTGYTIRLRKTITTVKYLQKPGLTYSVYLSLKHAVGPQTPAHLSLLLQ